MMDRNHQQPSGPRPGGREPTQPRRETGSERGAPGADRLPGRFSVAALAGAAVCLLAVPPAFGQFRISPAYNFRQGAPLNQNVSNLAVLGQALNTFPPYAFPYNSYVPPLNSFVSPFGNPGAFAPSTPFGTNFTSYASPGYASPGYSSPYATSPGGTGYGGYATGSNPYSSYSDPYGGGLRGAADALKAQGTFEKDFQQARLLNQEVERSKVDTRRKIYDEWLYERANTPTLVDQEERVRKLETRRALGGMPLSEVLSGYALNTLLDDLKKRGNGSARDISGPIDPEILKHINVTSGSSAGNVGALKPLREGAPLNWPLPLQDGAYRDEVRRLNQRAAEAVMLVQNTGQVDPGTLNDMREDLRRLRLKVSARIDDLSPSQSIQANRFLHQLSDAVTALAEPDIASYFTDQFAARGATVPELVDHMARKGLRFAPAVGGDEAAYSALYDSLAAYDSHAAQPNIRE